jgi:hypothetical protein
VIDAVKSGGGFAEWKRALTAVARESKAPRRALAIAPI